MGFGTDLPPGVMDRLISGESDDGGGAGGASGAGGGTAGGGGGDCLGCGLRALLALVAISVVLAVIIWVASSCSVP